MATEFDLSDPDLHRLFLAWMAQELQIDEHACEPVANLLAGLNPGERLPRARVIDLSLKPEELQGQAKRLQDAVEEFLTSYVLDILTTPTYAVPVSMLSLQDLTGLAPSELAWFEEYLRAQAILVTVTPHHWPTYDTYHLNPEFVDSYRIDLTTAYQLGQPVGEHVESRLLRLQTLADELEALIPHLPAEPADGLRLISERFASPVRDVLAAERIVLARRDASLVNATVLVA